ncbi:MAG: autotransporter-associated beta strand repeat-containing protein, partial [Thermoguttaceae bacterium]
MSNKTVLVFGCAVAILLLFPLAARAQTYWNVQSGDWSVASNWSNGLPGSYNDAYVTNGGTVSITQTEGQDGYPIPLCIGLSGGSGSVQMLGGSFAAGWQYVGYSGTGNFTQSGGTNGDAVNGADLCLASSSGSSGTYNLNGSGVLMDAILQVGYGGTGVFTQSGGTNTSGEFGGGQIGIVLGCSSGGSGTYHLSGSGYLSVVQDEFVGYNAGSTGLFQQSGGVNTTGGLIIGSGGRYVLSGGTLQLSGNPSAFVNVGTFDGGNSPATLSAANCTIDLTTGTWQNMGRTSVVMGANSLLLAPAGFNPSTAFASYSSSGITHIAGTPLTVPVGATVYGSFSLNDPVNCQGSISAFFDAGVVQKPAIYLNNGLVLSGSGSVSLGNGSLTVNDTSSGMTGSGSSLAAPNEYVGYGGTGVFTHSAGYNNLIPQSSSLTPGSIYLGYNQGDSGTYRLSGSGAISTSDPGIGYGNEYVGYLGTGNFTQSGGTNQTGTLTLGTTPGSSGTYSLSGTGLLSTTGNSGSGHGNEYVGCSGTGSFTQSGGTNQTGSLTIGSGGRYLLAGGSLQANGFGTGGTTALACSGTFDGGNGPAVLSLGAGCLADFSRGTLVNTGLTQLVMGANSLVVLPAGFAGGFAPSSSLGVVYTLGTTLVVPAGQGFSVPLSVSDPVVCQGSILAPGYPSWTSSPIYLNDGLILSGTGNVNLGTGNLTVNDTASGMSSGSLSASRNYVGYTGTGVFTQSGGTNSTQYLYLGGAPGTAGTYDLNGGTLIVSYITTGAGAAALNFNGGTLKAGGTLSVTMPMTLGTSGGNATVDTGGNTVTLSGVLSGPGSLAKIDSGTLILSAANTYAGSTAVNAGMLSLTGSLNSSSALVLGGGAFSYAPTANGGSGNSQTVAGLTVNVGASSVNASAGNPLALGPITRNPGGTVGFNTNTTGTITTSQTNTNGILGPWATYGSGTSTSYATATGSGAPYAIAAYTGATPITSGVTGLTDTTGTVNYALSSGGGTLTAAVGANTLQFTGAAGTVTVSGTNSLSLNGIMNAGSGTATIAGENLIIGSTRELVFTGPGSVTVGATVQDNGSGPSAVTMAGSGTLVLGTANTYSGNTFISGGTLVLGAANSCSGNTFISGGTLALANSAALQQSTLDTSCSGSLSFGSLGSARLGSLTGPGTLTLNNTASAAVALSVGNNNASTTFSGILQGAGSLTKIGSGTFILSGSNTYSGGTTVSAGTLQVGDGTANNGCIQGNILDNARMAFANAAAQTYAGAIAGTGCLIMAGPGTLTLSGSNTYTGGTTVFAGTLQLGDGTANNGYVQGNITD